MAFLLLVVFSRFQIDNFEMVLFGMFIAAASYSGLYTLTKGIEIGKAGVVTTISSARIAVTAVISVLFLGDLMSGFDVVAIILIIAGLAFTSMELKGFRSILSEAKTNGSLWGIASALGWGVTFAFFGIPSAALGAMMFTFFAELALGLMAAGNALLVGDSIILSRDLFRRSIVPILAASIPGFIAGVAMNESYATGEIALTTAITSCSPLVSIIVARIFFKEKLAYSQIAGAALTLIGIVCISFL